MILLISLSASTSTAKRTLLSLPRPSIQSVDCSVGSDRAAQSKGEGGGTGFLKEIVYMYLQTKNFHKMTCMFVFLRFLPLLCNMNMPFCMCVITVPKCPTPNHKRLRRYRSDRNQSFIWQHPMEIENILSHLLSHLLSLVEIVELCRI